MASDNDAWRMMNLAFTLNTSRRPVTTEEIVSDSDLGYGSANKDSDKRKFRRDRAALAERGIHVREIRPLGAKNSDQSSWTIDDNSTYADTLDAADTDTLLAALDDQMSRTDLPFRGSLPALRTKVAMATGRLNRVADGTTESETIQTPSNSAVLDAVWGAYLLRRGLLFAYRDGSGIETKRTVFIYGIFTRNGLCYFVGMDDVAQDIRTFRTDRVARAYQPKPKDVYEIPDSFHLDEYLFLPFDLAMGDDIDATFSFPATTNAEEIRSLGCERGTLERDVEGFWRWSVHVRDLDAAAAFALSHARRGMRCLEPPALVDSWNRIIKEVVECHAGE